MEFSHPDTELPGQPIGYWSTAAAEAVVGHIRGALAERGITQPQWWILAQLAGSEDGRTRTELADLLSNYL
ncbi:MAG TPA: MarR family transcriptional regulator, partial [Streptomyces sp.]|nr:MarR family transcriptional regulator [Streptomyces sp.]